MSTHILDDNAPAVNPTGAPSNDYETIQASPTAFGAGIGAATEKLGSAVTGAADAGLDVMTTRQTQLDDIHAASLSTWQTDNHTDTFSAFSRLQGQDALNALPQYKADLEATREKAVAQAGSPLEKAMVAKQSAALTDMYYKLGTQHADRQFDVWRQQTATDTAKSFSNKASIFATNGDFTNAEHSLTMMDSTIRANNKGLDPMSINAEVAAHHGASVANIVEQLGTVGIAGSGAPNLDVAQAFFKKHEEEMDAPTRLRVEQWLAPRMLSRQAESLGSAIVGGQGLLPDPNYKPSAGEAGPGHGRGSINAPYTAPLDQARVPGGPAPSDMFNYALAKGATRNEAIMLTSAAGNEGQYNPAAPHDIDPATGKPTGYGLFGHRLDRRDALFEYAGTKTPTWQQQTDFALQELRSRPESALVNSATTPVELANAEMHFEQPRAYSKDDPMAGENYNGRLNTIKRVSQLSGSTDGDEANPPKPGLDKAAAIQKAMDLTADNPALRDKTISVINRRYAQFGAANATEKMAIGLDYKNQLAAAEAGDPNASIPTDRIAALYPGPKAQEMTDQFEIAKKVGTVLSGIQYGSPADVEAAYKDVSSGLGPISTMIKTHAKYGATGPGTVGADPDDPMNGAYFKLREGAQVKLQQVINKRNQALLGEHADPAGYVAAEPSVAAAMQAASKDPTKIQDYATTVLGVQTHLGVPEDQQHIYSRDQAITMSQKLMTNGTDVRGNLQQLQQHFGDHYPKVFSDLVQLGKLPSSYQAVGVLDAPNGQLLSKALQQSPGTGDDGKKAETWDQRIITATGANDAPQKLKASVNSSTSLQSYLNSMKTQGISGPQIDSVTRDVQMLAQAKVYWQKMDPAAAADSAVEAFAGQFSFLPNGGARVPSTIADAVKSDAATTLRGLDQTKIAIPPGFGGPGQPSSDDYLRTVKSAPTWVNSPKADGLLLLDHGGRLVRGRDGVPLTVPFSSAGRIAAAAPPPNTSAMMGP